jgi:hypothetical protein
MNAKLALPLELDPSHLLMPHLPSFARDTTPTFRILTRALLMLVPLAILAGCSNEMGCSDSSTKSEVLQVIDSNMQQARWYVEAQGQGNFKDFAIEDIQTTAVDKDTKQHQCHAKLTWTYKGRAKEKEFDYETDFMEDKGKSEVRVQLDPISSALMVSAMGY